jgi:integrase
MSVQKLPSGRWRARVWAATEGREVSVSEILGLRRGETWPNKRAAERAEHEAYTKMQSHAGPLSTVGAWWERWTTDPLFAVSRSEQTVAHNRERTKAFAQAHADRRLSAIGDEIVAEWLAGGKRNGQVAALRAMFADAAKPEAGRLLSSNPFAGLGVAKGKGRKDKAPPSLAQLENMIRIAWDLTPPSFAGYLEFGSVSACRPGELDALLLDKIDLAAGEIEIDRQWNAKLGKFTAPKTGAHTIALIARAREVILRLPRGRSPYVFETLRGHHYTPSTRSHHWNRVRCSAGLAEYDLYDVTRHFFGWYALNILRLPPHVIAVQFGHKDGGRLITQLYGHPDQAIARDRIREAYDEIGQLRMLRPIKRGEVG